MCIRDRFLELEARWPAVSSEDAWGAGAGVKVYVFVGSGLAVGIVILARKADGSLSGRWRKEPTKQRSPGWSQVEDRPSQEKQTGCGEQGHGQSVELESFACGEREAGHGYRERQNEAAATHRGSLGGGQLGLG